MDDLDRFYDLLGQLSRRTGGPRRLAGCTARNGWPKRGVYFFFEEGETRADGSPRAVRVGTHGLKAGSKSTLWGRLAQHRGRVSGAHAGGGNHRASIFRRHVGAALFDRDGDPLGIRESWSNRHAARDLVAHEHGHEVAVSEIIRAMPFLWLAVDDPLGPESHRGLIEAGSIALLSRRANLLSDPPSPHWLGNHADRDTIRTSGLWNVDHVDDVPHPEFLDVFEDLVGRSPLS